MKGPKYLQIKNDLLEKIQSGEFESGDRFYSEAELVKKYGVSSITVIRAIQELVTEGYLVRYQGKGTYVSRSRKRKLVEFSDIEIFAGKTEVVEVLSLTEGNDKKICEELKLKKNDTYYEIVRIRRVDDQPFILHYSYIPAKYIKKDAELSYYDSIYNRFKLDFDIHLYDEHSFETNEIQFPTKPEVAELLEMPTTEPTVFQIKKTCLEDGTVAEYVLGYKKWDYFKIEFSSFQMNH